MDKDDDTTELIESMHDSADTLESLIRDGRIPDTPPVDTLDEIKTAAYNRGFDSGYRAHKHDAFVPALLYVLAAMIAGFLTGVVI